MYSKIVHYGCSFTYGVDSGGDGIDDPDQSYPAHLSKKTNIPFVNRSNPGASLDQIALRIHEDLQNPASDINDKNALVIVNLTSPFRIMSTAATWWSSIVNDHQLGICNINASTEFNINQGIDTAINTLINEKDWLFYYHAYNTINSIYSQLSLEKKKFVYVDMLVNINELEKYFKLHSAIKNKMLTNEVGSIVKSISMPKTFYSKTAHFTGQGYELTAELILFGLQEMKLL